jgi:hypothetical protein
LTLKNIYGLAKGISMVFEIYSHFLFQRVGGDGTTMYSHDIRVHTIRCYLTHETKIYCLGVGILTVFEKFGHFFFKGEGPPCTVMTYMHIPSDIT